jgi:hypothetical protein
LYLAVSCGEESQALLATHDRSPILLHLGEPGHKSRLFSGLALQECDLLGVLANAQKACAKIRFVTLLLNVQAD